MTLPVIELLVRALTQPENMRDFSETDWDWLIRLARSADVIACLALIAEENGLIDEVPSGPRMHLLSAAIIARRQRQELGWEIAKIAEALEPSGVRLVLLKGAAYAHANLPVALGRMVSDIDILVPKNMLGPVESALMMKGWVSVAKTDYDQHYYRTWMHELPPMRNIQRGTVIDVHHAILPLSNRLHPSSSKLLEGATRVPGILAVWTLAPVDMLLHSAAHLFHEGEFDHGFRDLVDLDGLIRHFGTTDEFWRMLLSRAVELELTRPLFYALRYADMILKTPIPVEIQLDIQAKVGELTRSFVLSWMDFLFLRALVPPHWRISDRYTPLVKFVLYLRGHWLRMPTTLLIWHLCRKAWIGLSEPVSH